MEHWSDDLSAASLMDLASLQVENRIWGKDLRRLAQSLVESRLSKVISQDEYFHGRNRGQAEAVECHRRAAVISTQMCRAYSQV